ncbi:hypothetical protein M4D76_14460, partial [Peribacillus frigoritolerans]|uniref:hypothetical protein n=2 Tax=Peribacillus TaxID=2675229 RepID=UPI0021A2817E
PYTVFLKVLPFKIKNSIKKTLRLGDEGDVHEFGVFTREFGLLLVYFEFSLMNWGVYSSIDAFIREFRAFTLELECYS